MEKDAVKCHICGEWFGILTTHLRNDEGVTPDEYRRTYSLFATTPLKGWKRTEGRKKISIDPAVRKKFAHKRGVNPPGKKVTYTKESVMAEIRQLVKVTGRTPTHAELRVSGLNPHKIQRALGVNTVTEAMRQLGITPNSAGCRVLPARQPVVSLGVHRATEYLNLVALCPAQVRERLVSLSTMLGRAATKRELAEAGLHHVSVPISLGLPTMGKVWESIGVKPRRQNGGLDHQHFMHRPEVTA